VLQLAGLLPYKWPLIGLRFLTAVSGIFEAFIPFPKQDFKAGRYEWELELVRGRGGGQMIWLLFRFMVRVRKIQILGPVLIRTSLKKDIDGFIIRGRERRVYSTAPYLPQSKPPFSPSSSLVYSLYLLQYQT